MKLLKLTKRYQSFKICKKKTFLSYFGSHTPLQVTKTSSQVLISATTVSPTTIFSSLEISVTTTMESPLQLSNLINNSWISLATTNLHHLLHLTKRGYTVNTTARDTASQTKIIHLLDLQNLGDLTIFQADLTVEGSFDNPIAGCDLVFHVATPVDFASQDPENDMIKPAIQGTLNVLKACNKARTVKHVIMTSSAAAVSINKINGPDEVVIDSPNELVMDENHWTDVEFLSTEKPPTWGYPVSKTLAEKEAWKYAEENNLDLITVIPSLMAGPSLTPSVPSSICLAMSLLTQNEFLINALKGMQALSGSISVTHVEDVVRAHVFLAENESASGRYICSAINTSVPKLATFLNKRYPEYKVSTEFGDFPDKAKLILSSEKLVQQGFSFEYGIEDIYDESIDYFKKVGLLKA